MTREEALKTLKENLCGMCTCGSPYMESCDIRDCDSRNAINVLSAEPCEDAISRQAVMRALDEIGSDFDSLRNAVVSLDGVADAIQDLPSVTPQKMGRWIWKEGYRGIPYCKCSECGNGQWEMGWDYCPFCGVKMEESE